MPSDEKTRKPERVGGKGMSVGSRERTSRTAEARPGPAGGRKHDWIASQLRRVYDEALQEEIPEDMLRLLKQLEEKKPKGEDGG